MAARDIIVVGASAGGVEALSQLASGLPADLSASIFVVLHLPAGGVSALANILDRAGPLVCSPARDGELISLGHIYVAPVDHHLLVRRGHIALAQGPRENNHRPAVDPLFRSAARAYGSRVVGVILSGALDDGTAGLLAVKMLGGIAVVQSPDDALFSGMPSSALDHVDVDHCVSLAEIPPLLNTLAKQQVEESASQSMSANANGVEVGETNGTSEAIGGVLADSSPVFSCPDCSGPLRELRQGELLRYRCRVGHIYSTESMLAAQSEALESALWVALRTLEDTRSLSDQMAQRAERRGHRHAAERFAERARDASARAAVVRRALRGYGQRDSDQPSSPSAVSQVVGNE